MCVRFSSRGNRLMIRPQISEKLYQQGFLSYPRTETDKFDAQFNFMSLIEKQIADPAWGGFARECVRFLDSPPWLCICCSPLSEVYIRVPSSDRETAETMTMHTLPSIRQRMLGTLRGTTSACTNTSLVDSSRVVRRTLLVTKLGSKLSMVGKSFMQLVS